MAAKIYYNFPFYLEHDVDGVAVEIELRYDFKYYPGRPAKIHCPVEDSHPEEPAEIEIQKVQAEDVVGNYYDYPYAEFEEALIEDAFKVYSEMGDDR